MRWLMVIAVLGYLSGCTPCDECDIFVSEPTISLEIFNQDSLTQVTQLLEEIEEDIDATTLSLVSLDSSRTAIGDSIEVVVAIIDTGNVSLGPTLDILQSELLAVNSNYSVDSLLAVELDSINELFNDAMSELEAGLTRIDTLFNLDGGSYITNTDSSVSFNLPLSPTDNQVNYRLTIGSERIDLSLTYDTELYEDEKSRVGYLARNISLVSHSFDSLNIDCEENCISTNGKIVAYH